MMAHINLPSTSGSKPPRLDSPPVQSEPEKPPTAAPSPRETAGAEAPSSLVGSLAASAVPHFEKRNLPAPELPGIAAWVDQMNPIPHPPKAVLKNLREAKTHFANLVREGKQTQTRDSEVSRKVIHPILRSENARTPGLNAVACGSEMKMGEALQELAKAGGQGEEGHVRFHLGLWFDSHRIAVDAFRHREGGFTLVAVDSMRDPIATTDTLALLKRKNPDLIKGIVVIPTPNLAHIEGCRIFAVHHLNALHDFQPDVQSLHRQIYDKGKGRSAPQLSGPAWKKKDRNTYIVANAMDAFGVLPGKFFKHKQVLKPKTGETRTLLDDAEERNPALKHQAVNKKDQTLRERFTSQNPKKALEEFSRADRTLSIDKKRVTLIDRAIEHYEGLAAHASQAPTQSSSQGIAGFIRSLFAGSAKPGERP